MAKPSANTPHSAEQAPRVDPRSTTSQQGQSVLLGWFCPEMAAGRPGIRPLFAKDPTWNSERSPLEMAIASRRVKRFTVLAWQGHRAGSLMVVGAAQDATGKMALGSYLGTSACQPKSSSGDPAEDDPTCLAFTHGCGAALGGLEAAGGFQARPYEEDPDALRLFAGAACESKDVLSLDTDGDGQLERFSISDLRSRGPAPVELPLAKSSAEPCSSSFAAPVKGHADLVRMAVLDVDGDGRLEVLYRRNDHEFLLYGAPTNPARLELLGRQTLTVAP